MPRSRRTPALLAGAALVAGTVWFGNDALRRLEPDTPSASHGTPADGHLVHGKRIPTAGPGHTTYSRLGALLGRTSAHGTVRDVLLDAFAALADDPTFAHRVVVGETGWPSGGPFRPHKTHQNGLAVDIFVPVSDAAGAPAPPLLHPGNLWGYRLDFDADGRLGDRSIDFPALARLLGAIDAAARDHGARVERVVFDPALQPRLFDAPGGRALARRLPFSKTRAWVRHDEHVHLVFRLP